MAKQWSPGEAGLSRMELQAALSLVQGNAQPPLTAANTFINETEATATESLAVVRAVAAASETLRRVQIPSCSR